MTEDCGRPTRTGTACTRGPMMFVGWQSGRSLKALACHQHSTADELADFRASKAAILEEDHRQFVAGRRALPVECWSWLVGDEDRRRAAEVQACPDPDRAFELATKLLAEWQRDRCAVCGKPGPDRTDHDHETGDVRGRLCKSCNSGEGFAHIPGDRFDRYRRQNPASMLGLKIQYRTAYGWAAPPWNPMTIEEAGVILQTLKLPPLPEPERRERAIAEPERQLAPRRRTRRVPRTILTDEQAGAILQAANLPALNLND